MSNNLHFSRSILKALSVVLMSSVLTVANVSWAEVDSVQLQQVTLQLRWKHQFQFAGYYAALHKGYYQEAGLEVQLKEGNERIDPVAEVVSGRSHFGIGMSNLVVDYLHGKPICVLNPIFQHSPNILIAYGKDRRLIDFSGKDAEKIFFMMGDQDVELKAMFVNEGIGVDKINLADPNDDRLDGFIERRIGAINAYISNEPFTLGQQGIPYTLLRPETYGLDFYGDVLFTHQQLAEQDPELIEKFRKASLKGWRYALNHPEEIIDLIIQEYNTQQKTRDHLSYEAKSILNLINPNIIEIGHNNIGRWRHIASTYQSFGIVGEVEDIDALFFQSREQRSLWLYGILVTIALVLLLTIRYAAYFKRKKEEIEKKHKNTRDSIDYASLIQGALIPNKTAVTQVFSDCACLWMPKDTVGGDLFSFSLLNDDEALLFVVDCTGHGVHGALLTMLVKAVEQQVVAQLGIVGHATNKVVFNPAVALQLFNQSLKTILYQNTNEENGQGVGFDGAVLYYNKSSGMIRFAGARTSLFHLSNQKVNVIKGDRHSIGYRSSDSNYSFKEHQIFPQQGDRFFITTDGYLDQNGGTKGYPLGRSRWISLLTEHHDKSLEQLMAVMRENLVQYRGSNEQTDDVTVIGLAV